VVRSLLVRGLLVGLVAGVVAFVVAKLLGESAVGHAIGFESARDATEHISGGPELVSRTVQNTAGLATGALLFSVALGGLYSLAYACVQGRLGTIGARGTAALVALGGFTAMYLLPALKYPANPPSIGNPDTIGRRTALYFIMILISLIVVIGAARTARSLLPRFGTWNAWLIAVGGAIAVIAICYVVMPKVDETPKDFPADVLWRFRLASFAIQIAVWSTLGLLFGALTERWFRRQAASSERPAAGVPGVSEPSGSR
jgi:hypothetical protein